MTLIELYTRVSTITRQVSYTNDEKIGFINSAFKAISKDAKIWKDATVLILSDQVNYNLNELVSLQNDKTSIAFVDSIINDNTSTRLNINDYSDSSGVFLPNPHTLQYPAQISGETLTIAFFYTITVNPIFVNDEMDANDGATFIDLPDSLINAFEYYVKHLTDAPYNNQSAMQPIATNYDLYKRTIAEFLGETKKQDSTDVSNTIRINKWL